MAPLHILLAEDDHDDRFFFEMELNVFSLKSKLTMVEDGEKLMKHLHAQKKLPDILFLDLNMPRMNGNECLSEIKKTEKLKSLPVIIYSTALNDQITDELYRGGAHYFCQKKGTGELHQLLDFVLPSVKAQRLKRPDRNKFILTFKSTSLK